MTRSPNSSHPRTNPAPRVDKTNAWRMIYTMNRDDITEMSTQNEKPGAQKATRIIAETIGGARRHESLSQAASYALLMESDEVANLLHDKLIQRNQLVTKLVSLHTESGGELFPGVTTDGGLATFMAIEELAKTNPGLHPVLGEIAALEKLKYMAGGNDARISN